MSIFISFATSFTSGFVLRELLSQDNRPPLILHVRSQASAEKLKLAIPELAGARNVEFAVADPFDVPTIARAMSGADTVWYSARAFLSLSTALAIAFVDAAVTAGVKHYVLCSVLHPILSKLPLSSEMLPYVTSAIPPLTSNNTFTIRVEEYLVESGLTYTILQVSRTNSGFP
jgi:hypothetical protein